MRLAMYSSTRSLRICPCPRRPLRRVRPEAACSLRGARLEQTRKARSAALARPVSYLEARKPRESPRPLGGGLLGTLSKSSAVSPRLYGATPAVAFGTATRSLSSTNRASAVLVLVGAMRSLSEAGRATRSAARRASSTRRICSSCQPPSTTRPARREAGRTRQRQRPPPAGSSRTPRVSVALFSSAFCP
jgi:hypothetical protein